MKLPLTINSTQNNAKISIHQEHDKIRVSLVEEGGNGVKVDLSERGGERNLGEKVGIRQDLRGELGNYRVTKLV